MRLNIILTTKRVKAGALFANIAGKQGKRDKRSGIICAVGML